LLAQVPDQFDRQARCLVVSPVSGSRGIYGAIGVGGAWGLPRGCAVVYTDKGAGTGFFDLAADEGVALDGRRARRGSELLDFDPHLGAGDGFETRWPGVAIKHAHSTDHPEADWGQHTLQALQFGLQALNLAFPGEAPFAPDNTQIIGLAISNGGGALLRASELDAEGWFDAVIAGEPNILAPGAPPLFDFALEAAILQPCAWLARPLGPQLASSEQLRLIGTRRCQALQEAGLLAAGTVEAQAAEALARLRANGWEDAALGQMGVLTPIDVWRAVVATYLQSYSRSGPVQAHCGYRFATLGPERQPQPTAMAARALWWADASGVAPTAGIALVDELANGHDPALPGLLCARALRQSNPVIEVSIEGTRGNARPGSRVAIVHGLEDGLVPIAFSSRPYARAAAEQGHAVRLYSIPHVQHFDAFLGIPAVTTSQLPLLPYLFQAADHAWRSIVEGGELPADQTVVNRLRTDITLPLTGADLGEIR
jgi:hydroxybutyrate-dimer hydrolase